jgi:nucleoid DNA-binding protein
MINMGKNDQATAEFVQDITETLLDGKRHLTPGFGTFSTCARKATAERAACKIAMFRASSELREYASGGKTPNLSGPHAELLSDIVETMQSEEGIEVPLLGRLAVVPVPGKSPKLIFHGAAALNDALTNAK